MTLTTEERPAPVSTPADEDAFRTEAVASLKRKRRFASDAAGYLAVNGILWLIWALGDRSLDGSMPWPAWVSAIWGFFLALDAWRAYGPWPGGLAARPISDAEIEREAARLRRSQPN